MRPQPSTVETVFSGEATALDVENLILHVQQTVLDSTGIELVPEVRVVGREAT